MSSKIRNILFIMADQLRWDYLSCYGHPHLKTPNIDRLAARGVRFDRAYCQSPVCGPSRASFYTGRTVFSHGATWNFVPLPIGEWTMGDYLAPLGMRTAVVGKTGFVGDVPSLARLGLTTGSEVGFMVAQGGFEPFERDDGVHPTPLLRMRGGKLKYNDWLRARGYEGENPWNDYANSALGPNGEILSGWELRNSSLPARIREEHSETAYMTQCAPSFIENAGDAPWLCHLSYIKPHWPYMAPAPYHDMYGKDSFLPVNRSEREREAANPVFRAFMDMEATRTCSRPGARDNVLPAYMGLVKQIDDHLGRLFDYLERSGRSRDTMIVLTSDHGDYLGDHWMGEKELFHEPSVRIPLIVVDPRPSADATRGTARSELVEAIDLLPTFVEATGAPDASHRLEGRSLMPLIEKRDAAEWREAAFSEIDYSMYAARRLLGVDIQEARGYMVCTRRWKYVYFKSFPPQLFDLENDPAELADLGTEAGYQAVRDEMQRHLLERLLARKNRVAISDQGMEDIMSGHDETGILIGKW